jgi:hypothetical protein
VLVTSGYAFSSSTVFTRRYAPTGVRYCTSSVARPGEAPGAGNEVRDQADQLFGKMTAEPRCLACVVARYPNQYPATARRADNIVVLPAQTRALDCRERPKPERPRWRRCGHSSPIGRVGSARKLGRGQNGEFFRRACASLRSASRTSRSSAVAQVHKGPEPMHLRCSSGEPQCTM